MWGTGDWMMLTHHRKGFSFLLLPMTMTHLPLKFLVLHLTEASCNCWEIRWICCVIKVRGHFYLFSDTFILWVLWIPLMDSLILQSAYMKKYRGQGHLDQLCRWGHRGSRNWSENDWHERGRHFWWFEI